MSGLLEHYHGENWKSPTRSFGRSGKAKRTFQGTKKNAPSSAKRRNAHAPPLAQCLTPLRPPFAAHGLAKQTSYRIAVCLFSTIRLMVIN